MLNVSYVLDLKVKRSSFSQQPLKMLSKFKFADFLSHKCYVRIVLKHHICAAKFPSIVFIPNKNDHKHFWGILRGQVQWGRRVGGVRSPLTSADLTNDLKRDSPAVTTALSYCCIVVL